jgi:hypothetical protein
MQLQAHEALVIVGSGVDEVTEDLLPGPLVRGWLLRCGVFGDRVQARKGTGDNGRK